MSSCKCGRETRDDAYLCQDCGDELARALGDMPALDEELDVTITRQRALPTEGGSAGAETPLPWHAKAAEAQHHLKALLVTWARMCEEEHVRHCSPRTKPLDEHDDNIPALSRWLLWRVDGLELHPAGPDAHEEITDAVAQCRRLVDRPPERWYAGPCDLCRADLYATSRQGQVQCRTEQCPASYDIAERRDWLLAAAEDRLVGAADLARAVSWLGAQPLTRHRVGMWAKRGRILAKGHDGTRPLYRVGDAIDLLARESVNIGSGG